jgi:hypothetical protein
VNVLKMQGWASVAGVPSAPASVGGARIVFHRDGCGLKYEPEKVH